MAIDLKKLRNIGIAAHIDAGKTTTTERILFYTGRTHRMGDVDDGTTTTDFDEQEQQRGITIYSAAVTCPWKDHTINLIDTPGHVDFTAEVERSLRVLDGVVAVFDAKEGVEAQSETVWRQAAKYQVPRICLINKMDKVGADFDAAVDSIRARLGGNPAPIHWPIGSESTFEGLIDLVSMRAVRFPEGPQGAARVEISDVPESLRDEALARRHALLEVVAETSDVLMDKYLHDEPVSEEELRRALRQATISNALQPVLCGSALRSKGIRTLLDAVCDYFPSPLDRPPVRAQSTEKHGEVVEVTCDPTGPFAALVFKIIAERPVDLYYLRIYSGTLRAGTRVFNPATLGKENISRIFRMFAKKRVQIDEAVAGDIVAVIGLKRALTGQTLCDAKRPLLLESITFPPAVVSRSIEPKSSRDSEKLMSALHALGRQDPTFEVQVSEETGEILISGMGELHLDVLVHRLETEMNAPVNVGRPRVSFRETITKSCEAEGQFVRQIGGQNHFAVVRIRLEPLVRNDSHSGDGACEFTCGLEPGTLPDEFIQAVEQGVHAGAMSGIVYGAKVIDWHATLVDAQQHEGESTEMAFVNAGRYGFERAMRGAGAILLEPVMKVEVVTPEEFFGAVSGDLNARRAAIHATEVRGSLRMIQAEVPLRELFGYMTDLRSLTQGRATAAMEMARYAPAPMPESM